MLLIRRSCTGCCCCSGGIGFLISNLSPFGNFVRRVTVFLLLGTVRDGLVAYVTKATLTVFNWACLRRMNQTACSCMREISCCRCRQQTQPPCCHHEQKQRRGRFAVILTRLQHQRYKFRSQYSHWVPSWPFWVKIAVFWAASFRGGLSVVNVLPLHLSALSGLIFSRNTGLLSQVLSTNRY
jgi:hypothetical protein